MVSHIVAVAKNGVIGKNNEIPWRLPDDMKYFKDTTMHHHVVTGRKNYESIPQKFRPLLNRLNIIITRERDFVLKYHQFHMEGCFFFNQIEDAIELGKNCGKETFIIGGGEIYALSLPLTDRLYITEIDAEIDGDVFYPKLNMEEWEEVSRVHHTTDEKHMYAFDFVVYDRKIKADERL